MRSTSNLLLIAACVTGATAQARAQIGTGVPQLNATEERRIDGAKLNLVPIGSMTLLPNGTLVVTQPADRGVVFFGRSGELLGKFGRGGQGPGEFTAFSRIGTAADTLWVYDSQQRKLTFVSPDRSLIRSVVFGAAHPAPADSAKYPRLSTVTLVGAFPGGDVVASASPGPGDTYYPPAWDRTRTPILQMANDGTIKRQIGWLPRTEGVVSATTGGTTTTSSIPFFARAQAEFSDNGARYMVVTPSVQSASGGTIRFVALNMVTGDTVYAREYPFKGIPIAQKSLDSARAAWHAAQGLAEPSRSALEKAIAAYGSLPPVYSPIGGSLFPGSDGSLWMRERAVGDNRVYFVLDSKGAIYGRLTIPANVMLWEPTLSGFWATELDADDVPSIVYYRVAK